MSFGERIIERLKGFTEWLEAGSMPGPPPRRVTRRMLGSQIEPPSGWPQTVNERLEWIAVDVTMPLVMAREAGLPIDRDLIRSVRDRVVQHVSRAHFGCHPGLEAEEPDAEQV